MSPLTSLVDRLAARYAERALARLALVLAATLVVVLLFGVWYVGSMGLTLGAMGYDDDPRTVVIQADDRAQFEQGYRRDREEGWCLYGTANETHIVVTDVVHAEPLAQSDSRIRFTCLRATARQVLSGDDPRLLGAAHSHPNFDRSYLSYRDVLLWGQVAPVVEVMGVYTQEDGIALFTVQSMRTPLDVRTVDGEANAVNGTQAGGRPGATAVGIETP